MLLTYVSWYAYRQGIWGGMIGGTVMQTAILLWVTIRTDWNKEVPVTKPTEKKDLFFISILHKRTTYCKGN
jgi:hypothetical protein